MTKPSRKPENRRKRHALLHSKTIQLDTSDLEAWIETIGEAAEQAVRPATHDGARVIYEAVKANVARIPQKTGNLAQSIYYAYSRDNSVDGRVATYHISWNASTAPHGGLLEYGHWQRYAARYVEGRGWVTLVRPEMRGQPKPRRRASQAQKDAYYVLRRGGPVYIPGKAFMRQALISVPDKAIDAARTTIFKALEEVK